MAVYSGLLLAWTRIEPDRQTGSRRKELKWNSIAAADGLCYFLLNFNETSLRRRRNSFPYWKEREGFPLIFSQKRSLLHIFSLSLSTITSLVVGTSPRLVRAPNKCTWPSLKITILAVVLKVARERVCVCVSRRTINGSAHRQGGRSKTNLALAGAFSLSNTELLHY